MIRTTIIGRLSSCQLRILLSGQGICFEISQYFFVVFVVFFFNTLLTRFYISRHVTAAKAHVLEHQRDVPGVGSVIDLGQIQIASTDGNPLSRG